MKSEIHNPKSQMELDWTLDPAEARVLAVLGEYWGMEHAVKIPRLAGRVEIGTRELQKVIRRLCMDHGYPILSGSRGVWMAATADELLCSYREQRRKAISTLIRQRRVYRRHLARLRGQQEMVA